MRQFQVRAHSTLQLDLTEIHAMQAVLMRALFSYTYKDLEGHNLDN